VWRKSSRSGDNGGQCVEVAFLTGAAGGTSVVGLRDSKDPSGPVLAFTPVNWIEFVAGIMRGTVARQP
jgi:hypothetical protein